MSAGGTSTSRRTSEIDSDANERAVALLDLSISLIDQALEILNRHMKEDRQLTHASKLMPGGSVGKHFRHVMEMFRALLLPLQPSEPRLPLGPLEVNYDAILPSSRKPLARSLPACRKAMAGIKVDLEAWRDRANNTTDRVAGEVGLGGLEGEMRREVTLVAVTPTQQEMKSSVGRELWFCALHAIHHFSMLRTIAVHELGLKLPTEFGTAPSTLMYRAKGFGKSPEEQKDMAKPKAKL